MTPQSVNQNAQQEVKLALNDVEMEFVRSTSPDPSSATVSMHGSQQQSTYENRAYENESMSASTSDRLSLAGAMSTDVSDIANH